jgi:leader peptidase (prepilin peptidase)/N-methyltransferase
MDWLEPAHLQAALACLVACGALGWFVPTLIGRIPEPEPAPETAAAPDPDSVLETGPRDEQDGERPVVEHRVVEERRAFDRSLPPAPDKVPYAEIASAPGLGVWTALAAAFVGASFGAALGWTGALLYLVPLVPIGVALMVIDWRTTLLPTRVIHPTYVLLVVLIPVAALVDQDLDSLYRAGWGWLVIGAWFWVFWWLFNAWGFGDVRLARVLGPALGFLGWYELLAGLALMLIVGGIGGLFIGIATRDLRRRVPYGPFMLVGSALSVVLGPWLARGLGY